MTAKCQAFLDALTSLCREHGVQLSTSGYDGLQVWDLVAGEDPVYANGIEDKTKPAATESSEKSDP